MEAYIVHFDDKPWKDLDDELYYRCFEIPWFSTTKTTISRLTPYTEDSAYAHGYTEAESKYREIRDELEKQAYQRGYEEAYDTAYADAEGIYESGKRAMYQKGLKDAWEAARKIASDNAGRNYAIFGQHFTAEILNTHSASEALTCLEQHHLFGSYLFCIRTGDRLATVVSAFKVFYSYFFSVHSVSFFNETYFTC